MAATAMVTVTATVMATATVMVTVTATAVTVTDHRRKSRKLIRAIRLTMNNFLKRSVSDEHVR